MTDYEISKEFSDAVENMLNDTALPELNPIREHDLQIYSLLEVRQGPDGEPLPFTGPPVTCRRIPPVYKALFKGHYVVVGNHDWWTHADGIQQKAGLHHALMSIEVEIKETKTGQKVKLVRRPPDVVAYTHTISHYGAWNSNLISFKDAFKVSAKQFAENLKPKA